MTPALNPRHTQNMLRVSDLGRKFGARWIFRHVEFELRPGDVLMVLGDNGSGKSTLLRIVAGLLARSEGRLERPYDDHRTGLGYASLDLSLYPHLTAAEHLKLAASLRGVDDRAAELLDQIQLADFADAPTGAFSTGMRARLKLAMAVQAKPALLLLDEPTASLDERGRRLVECLVLEQQARGVTLLATNDPNDKRMATHELHLGA